MHASPSSSLHVRLRHRTNQPPQALGLYYHPLVSTDQKAHEQEGLLMVFTWVAWRLGIAALIGLMFIIEEAPYPFAILFGVLAAILVLRQSRSQNRARSRRSRARRSKRR